MRKCCLHTSLSPKYKAFSRLPSPANASVPEACKCQAQYIFNPAYRFTMKAAQFFQFRFTANLKLSTGGYRGCQPTGAGGDLCKPYLPKASLLPFRSADRLVKNICGGRRDVRKLAFVWCSSKRDMSKHLFTSEGRWRQYTQRIRQRNNTPKDYVGEQMDLLRLLTEGWVRGSL